VEFNNPVIGPAWKGRFFSTRGTSAFRRGGISLLTIALEYLALLLIYGERGTPSREEPQPFLATGRAMSVDILSNAVLVQSASIL
jgi:hypothetical protein